MADARPAEAFHAQPAGVALFVLTVILSASTITTAILGHLPSLAGRVVNARMTAIAGMAVLLGAWCYKILVSI